MITSLKKLDVFSKNIILVFFGTSLVNLFNLFYQLLIAHSLKPSDFASFNVLVSIFTIISAPLANFQMVIAKYTSEFNAKQEAERAKSLISSFLRYAAALSVVFFVIFYSASYSVLTKLKIDSHISGTIVACLIAISTVVPVLMGALQGIESFKWLTAVSVSGGVLKLSLAILFIWLGFNIAGALGALLLSNIVVITISLFPLKKFMNFKNPSIISDMKNALIFILPVAVSSFCFMLLVNMDMILVKYYFTENCSGTYSISQMVGKIFLFLPAAISVVMFPRTSGLNAKNMDTFSTLKKSLFYGGLLCCAGFLFFNAFPGFILRVLTGKTIAESVALGRLFSFSMSFFTLSFIILSYFLSIKDLRFMKYLVLFTVLQFIAITAFHKNLIFIQVVLCINSLLLFLTLFKLANLKADLI